MTQRIAVFPADRHSLYDKGYCPNPLMLILGKTGSIICTGFILFIPALHPV